MEKRKLVSQCDLFMLKHLKAVYIMVNALFLTALLFDTIYSTTTDFEYLLTSSRCGVIVSLSLFQAAFYLTSFQHYKLKAINEKWTSLSRIIRFSSVTATVWMTLMVLNSGLRFWVCVNLYKSYIVLYKPNFKSKWSCFQATILFSTLANLLEISFLCVMSINVCFYYGKIFLAYKYWNI